MRPSIAPTRLRNAVAALCVVLLAGTSWVMSPTPAGHADASSPAAPGVCGTWALQQVSSIAELDSWARQIDSALALQGVTGLSVRVPWRSIDTSFALLDRAKAIADARGKALSVRFMAGRHTPSRVFEAGSPSYESGGQPVPAPFHPDGSPNTVFEAAYGDIIARLANWSRANDVGLLHLPWYGQDWAELNHGIEVRSAPGYTQDRWLSGHLRLVDVAARYGGNGLALELPLSGYGPLPGRGVQGDLAEAIAAVNARFPFYVQANGWNEIGEWGAPSPEVEADHDAVWSIPVPRALQMIQPGSFDWDAVYARLDIVGADYAEVYLPSFSAAGADSLAAEIAAFAAGCGTSGGGGPGPGPDPDTTGPSVSITAPAGGSTLSGVATVTVAASDPSGVASVRLALDGATVGTDVAAPYLFSIDTTGRAGSHVLTATATDAAGNAATSAPVQVTFAVGGGGGGDGGGGGGTDEGAAPALLIAGPANVSAVLFWMPPPSGDAAVVAYRYEIDGVARGEVSAGTLWARIAGLEPLHSYEAGVRALYANGDVSAPATVAFATSGCLWNTICL